MWFLCSHLNLLRFTRQYLLPESSTNAECGEILFVERVSGYRQAIGLTPDVKDKLRELGVTFFNPAKASIQQQIETFANAKIAIGVHGAGIANILWCQEGTKVVEIFHSKFAPWCYCILANQLNMNYYTIGRDPGEMNIDFREADVYVDWNLLIELIQQLKIDIA